jgi:hypothetical protein
LNVWIVINFTFFLMFRLVLFNESPNEVSELLRCINANNADYYANEPLPSALSNSSSSNSLSTTASSVTAPLMGLLARAAGRDNNKSQNTLGRSFQPPPNSSNTGTVSSHSKKRGSLFVDEESDDRDREDRERDGEILIHQYGTRMIHSYDTDHPTNNNNSGDGLVLERYSSPAGLGSRANVERRMQQQRDLAPVEALGESNDYLGNHDGSSFSPTNNNHNGNSSVRDHSETEMLRQESFRFLCNPEGMDEVYDEVGSNILTRPHANRTLSRTHMGGSVALSGGVNRTTPRSSAEAKFVNRDSPHGTTRAGTSSGSNSASNSNEFLTTQVVPVVPLVSPALTTIPTMPIQAVNNATSSQTPIEKDPSKPEPTSTLNHRILKSVPLKYSAPSNKSNINITSTKSPPTSPRDSWGRPDQDKTVSHKQGSHNGTHGQEASSSATSTTTGEGGGGGEGGTAAIIPAIAKVQRERRVAKTSSACLKSFTLPLGQALQHQTGAPNSPTGQNSPSPSPHANPNSSPTSVANSTNGLPQSSPNTGDDVNSSG